MEISQVSFGSGVISPATYSRVDLQKFGSAVKQADNYFVRAEGGLDNRAGLEFIKQAKSNSDTCRLINFEYNETDAYAIELGDQYMRFCKDGGAVLESNLTITGATAANPVVVTTSTPHSYSNGDSVYINSVVGMIQLNARYFTIANVTSTTFELSGIDGTAYTAYSSAGTVARVYEIATPYLHTELANLKFRQSNDVIYFGHRNHAPRKLSRLGATNWTLETVTFEPLQGYPTAINVAVVGATGSTAYKYRVTAVSAETGEESLVGLNNDAQAITGATAANPVVLTVTSHPFADGDEISIEGVVGMTELNGRRYTVANQTTNTIELSGIDGTGYTAYSSGGVANRTFGHISNGNAPLSTTNYNRLTWTAPSGDVDVYNIYRYDNGLYGYIGSLDASETLQFDDQNIDPDLEDTAPKWRQLFQTSGEYPEAVGLHEERSWWGNTDNNPLSVYSSQTGVFENTNVSSPTKATDAITLRLVSGKGNQIRHFMSFGERLFIFTSGAIWTMRPGGDTDAMTPSSKKTEVQEYLSSTQVPPLTIKKNILMVAGKDNLGFEVHSVGEDVNSGIAGNYVGSDLTVLARNLFEGYTIKEWAYIERPHRLILAVRSDGKLLVQTYLNEHQIYAWTLWDTDGTFESVCHVPDGQTDAAYFVVKRTINGASVKYIEKLHSRYFTDVADAFFVDSGLEYDGTNAVTVSGATAADPVVITATSHPYSNGDLVEITDIVGMTELNNREFTVANKTTHTFELLDVDGTAYTAYSSGGNCQLKLKSTQTILNLDHLEGRTDVIALADGNIESGLTVTNGYTTLSSGFTKLNIGLPYTAKGESIPVNSMQGSMGKLKNVSSVVFRTLDTRGIKAGPSVNKLDSYPSRYVENWGDPAASVSDVIKINISGDWGRDRTVHFQSEPGLPQSITSMIANVNVGGS